MVWEVGACWGKLGPLPVSLTKERLKHRWEKKLERNTAGRESTETKDCNIRIASAMEAVGALEGDGSSAREEGRLCVPFGC